MKTSRLSHYPLVIELSFGWMAVVFDSECIPAHTISFVESAAVEAHSLE